MSYLDENPQEVKNAAYYRRQVKKLEEDKLHLQAILQRIVNWDSFPNTGKFWDEPENTRPMSYAACYGSNGERDYIRQLAKDALND